MMQCKLHQTSWIDQDFSGGECSECAKERRERIQQINRLAAENRELGQHVMLDIEHAYEAMSALCDKDTPAAREARNLIADEIRRLEGRKLK